MLEQKGFDLQDGGMVAVTSEDNYTVSLTAGEVRNAGTVHLAVVADGLPVKGIENEKSGAQLIVFGDSDSKRCVRYVRTFALS